MLKTHKGLIAYVLMGLLLLSGVLVYPAEVKNLKGNQVGNRVLFEYDLIGDEYEGEVKVTIKVQGTTSTW